MMKRRRESWLEVFRSLGEAFFEVLRAELGVLSEHWKRAGAHLAIVVGLFVTAFGLLAVGGTLAIYTTVALVHELTGWSWGRSGGVVTLTVLLLAALLATIGYWRLQRIESPAMAFKDRLDDHVDWWKAGVLRDDNALPAVRSGGAEGGTDGDTDTGDGAARQEP